MYRKYNITVLIYLLPFLFIPMGLILLFSQETSNAEKFFSFNIISAGVSLLYWILYPKIWKKERPKADRIFWLNMITVFQFWILFPIYMHVSDRWRNKIDKVCKWFFIAIGGYLVLALILSFGAAFLRELL